MACRRRPRRVQALGTTRSPSIALDIVRGIIHDPDAAVRGVINFSAERGAHKLNHLTYLVVCWRRSTNVQLDACTQERVTAVYGSLPTSDRPLHVVVTAQDELALTLACVI
jgi:hypothetical protein